MIDGAEITHPAIRCPEKSVIWTVAGMGFANHHLAIGRNTSSMGVKAPQGAEVFHPAVAAGPEEGMQFTSA